MVGIRRRIRHLKKLWKLNSVFEQIELQAKLLNYFLGSNKSNINQFREDSDCASMEKEEKKRKKKKNKNQK